MHILDCEGQRQRREKKIYMSDQVIQASEHLKQIVQTGEYPKQSEPSAGAPLSLEPTMARICIELLTRAALYAGAIGLIVGLAAAFLFRE